VTLWDSRWRPTLTVAIVKVAWHTSFRAVTQTVREASNLGPTLTTGVDYKGLVGRAPRRSTSVPSAFRDLAPALAA